MASPENILLHLSAEQEQQVRNLFADLEALGFPRQNQTPHITITFSPAMAPGVVDRAAGLLPHVIPATLHRIGTVIFGTKRKQTVAWLLEAPEALEFAARDISMLNPDGRGARWVPHLTVGLRLPRDIVPDYLKALDQLTPPSLDTLTAATAAYWRPSTQERRMLAGGSPECSVRNSSRGQ